MCDNDPINAEVSPNGERVAIAFTRSCGATSPFYKVSILDAPGRLPNNSGNIFILEGKHPVPVSWEGNDELKIAAAGYGKQSLQLYKCQGISVSYE
jgi:hypothetical protein